MEGTELLGLLAGSTAAVRLACRSHLAVMLRSVPLRGRAAALMPQDGCRRHALLFEQIVGQGQGCAQVLAATGGAVLGKFWGGFKDQIRIGDQVLEGQQGSTVRWHTFMVRRDRRESKR